MKLKTIAACLSSCLMLITMTVQADFQPDKLPPVPYFNLTQRNCTPGDLTIENNGTTQTVTTDCIWQQIRKDGKGNIVKDKDGNVFKEDTDMQVTLKISDDVDIVGMHCTFVPSSTQAGNRDKIASISGAKAANSDGSSSPQQLPAGDWLRYSVDSNTGKTDIQAMIVNHKNVHDDKEEKHSHANVIFDLNQERNDRGWFSGDIAFNENNTLMCSFTPNLLPNLPVKNP